VRLLREPSNLSGAMRRAVKSMKHDESITILPADKGNATVIMDRTEYDDKLRSLLRDGNTYRKICFANTGLIGYAGVTSRVRIVHHA